MDANSLFFSIFFSIVGIGFFSYGRKHNVYFLIFGIALMVYPYFVNNLVPLIITGAVLTVAPFVLSSLLPL